MVLIVQGRASQLVRDALLLSSSQGELVIKASTVRKAGVGKFGKYGKSPGDKHDAAGVTALVQAMADGDTSAWKSTLLAVLSLAVLVQGGGRWELGEQELHRKEGPR
jgi:hypothetical protein